jgi:hypothetical protein
LPEHHEAEFFFTGRNGLPAKHGDLLPQVFWRQLAEGYSIKPADFTGAIGRANYLFRRLARSATNYSHSVYRHAFARTAIFRLHIGEQSLLPFEPANVQVAFAFVGVGMDIFDIVTRSVVEDCVGPVLGQIMLMSYGHAHELSRAAPKRQFVLHHDSYTSIALR